MNLRFIKKSPFDFAPLPISPYLVTQNDWNVFAVPELRSIFHEKRISREDGHSSQDERGKQIGVDVITCATELPATLQRPHWNCNFIHGELKQSFAA